MLFCGVMSFYVVIGCSVMFYVTLGFAMLCLVECFVMLYCGMYKSQVFCCDDVLC